MTAFSKKTQLLGIMLLYSLATGITAFCVGDTASLFTDLGTILTAPAQLTIDYFKISSVGGTFLNVSLVGLCCVLVFALSGAELSGVSLMAFFLTIGFSFFGLNVLNIWPCILGTWLFARVSKEPFGKYVNVALFSTSLAPFVSEGIWRYPIFHELPMPLLLNIPFGILLGVIAGFLMPVLCKYSVNLHHGYTLYNAAAVAGFIGILLFSFLFRAAGVEIPANTDIGDSYPQIGNSFILVTSLISILVGFFLNGRRFTGFLSIFRASGYGCDFTQTVGVPMTITHIGTFGLLAAGYYNLIVARMTGPTIGSMICLLAIAPCGAHFLNVVPIMLGYFLASLFAAFDLNTQAIVVGLCFACALCPISGCYGSVFGIIAGLIHACMVTTVVTFHGGFCLYNGGFTAGITAILMVPFLEHFVKKRRESYWQKDVIKSKAGE